MGTWSAKIEDDDTFLDIYDEFFNLYDLTNECLEIKEKLRVEYVFPRTEHLFWLALAKAFWECKQEDDEINEHIEELIKNKKDLEICRNLGFNESFIKEREKELDKFFKKISIKKTKPKARKKIKKPIFETGQIWTFSYNSIYFAFVVLAELNNVYGQNVIGLLHYKESQKPTFEDLKNKQIFYYEVDAYIQSTEPKFLIFKNNEVYSATILIIDRDNFPVKNLKSNFKLLNKVAIDISLNLNDKFHHHCGWGLIPLIEKSFKSKQVTHNLPIKINLNNVH